MKPETRTYFYLTKKDTFPQVYSTDQLRRAKIQVAEMDRKKVLTPALRALLEASLILQTTSTKTLAAYLKRSPATIRAEYQQILKLLGDNVK